MKKSFLITLLFLGHLYASSFNCDKATTNVEKSICSSLSLSQLDDKMSIKYNFIKKRISKIENKIFLKAQKRWLKERNKCETSSNIEKCLLSMYQNRLSEFEVKYSAILIDYPAQDVVDNICTQLARDPKLFIKKHALKISNDIDINNDGKTEQITLNRWGGLEYGLNNNVIYANRIGFNDNDRWSYRTVILRFAGKIFNLYTYDSYKYHSFENKIKPKYLTFINQADEEYLLCRFHNTTVEKMLPNENIKEAQELCSLIDTKIETTEEDDSLRDYIDYFNSEELQQIKFAKTSKLNDEYFKKTYDNTWISYENKEATFDYDNDGKKETLILIQHQRTKGDICDRVYFDEVNFSKNSSRKLLLKLQGLDISSMNPPCGQNNIFFSYKDTFYYEERGYDKHNVFQINNNNILTICTGSFNIITSVEDQKDNKAE